MNPTLKYLPRRGDKHRHFFPQHPKNMNATIDLEKEIVAANTVTLMQEEKHLTEQKNLDAELAKLESKVSEAYKSGLADELGFEYSTAEVRRIRKEREDFSALPQNRIMSTEAIKAVCLKFGLRFLPTRYYKGALDAGIGPAVEKVKELLGGKLPVTYASEVLSDYRATQAAEGQRPQFSIAAPSSAFALQPRPQDPLLFLRLNSLKWFLVHKWGDDLRTGDLRQGEINESNWNSTFSDEVTTRRGSRPVLSDYASMIQSIQSQSPFFNTTSSSSPFAVQQNASSQNWAYTMFNSKAEA